MATLALAMSLSSCVGDLDNAENPKDPNISTEYKAVGEYNKCYANLALPGNGGANGDSDLDGYDGGTAGFIRQMWNANELSTDEAICNWGDPGVAEFVYNTFGASHPMTAMYYYRLTTGITYCNDYLLNAADYDKTMTAEIRFVRALHYFYLMDALRKHSFQSDNSGKAQTGYTKGSL